MILLSMLKDIWEGWNRLKPLGKIIFSPFFLAGLMLSVMAGVVCFLLVEPFVFIAEVLSKDGSIEELWNFWVH